YLLDQNDSCSAGCDSSEFARRLDHRNASHASTLASGARSQHGTRGAFRSSGLDLLGDLGDRGSSVVFSFTPALLKCRTEEVTPQGTYGVPSIRLTEPVPKCMIFVAI